jgi:hypothetical protein
MNLILSPWQLGIDRAKESYLWLFSCGGMVNNAQSFAALQSAVLR